MNKLKEPRNEERDARERELVSLRQVNTTKYGTNLIVQNCWDILLFKISNIKCAVSHENRYSGFLTQSDTDWPVHSQ